MIDGLRPDQEAYLRARDELARGATANVPPSSETIAAILGKIRELVEEISFLRRYGNKDCTAMADEALTAWRAAGRPQD